MVSNVQYQMGKLKYDGGADYVREIFDFYFTVKVY